MESEKWTQVWRDVFLELYSRGDRLRLLHYLARARRVPESSVPDVVSEALMTCWSTLEKKDGLLHADLSDVEDATKRVLGKVTDPRVAAPIERCLANAPSARGTRPAVEGAVLDCLGGLLAREDLDDDLREKLVAGKEKLRDRFTAFVRYDENLRRLAREVGLEGEASLDGIKGALVARVASGEHVCRQPLWEHWRPWVTTVLKYKCYSELKRTGPFEDLPGFLCPLEDDEEPDVLASILDAVVLSEAEHVKRLSFLQKYEDLVLRGRINERTFFVVAGKLNGCSVGEILKAGAALGLLLGAEAGDVDQIYKQFKNKMKKPRMPWPFPCRNKVRRDHGSGCESLLDSIVRISPPGWRRP